MKDPSLNISPEKRWMLHHLQLHGNLGLDPATMGMGQNMSTRKPGCHKATNWGWFMANEPNLQQFSTKWVVLPWSLGTISESNWRLKSDSFQQGHSPQTNDWIIFVLIPGYVHFGSFWNYFLVKERVPTWRFPNCAQKKNDAHKNNLP